MNLTGWWHNVLYITPSGPFSMVTVDILAHVSTSVTTPADAMHCLTWSSTLNFINGALTHGFSCQLAEFKSRNRLDICFLMFKISTWLPLLNALSVNSTLLCTLANAVSNASFWISKDFSFAFLISSTLSIISPWRSSRQAASTAKQLMISWTVSSAQEHTFFSIAKTPSTASLRAAAFVVASNDRFDKSCWPLEKASLTKVYLWSRCLTMVQSLQIASSHVSQNSFITSPSCSLQSDGFATATDPIFLASSRDIRVCDRVLRPRLWAWLQKSHRK